MSSVGFKIISVTGDPVDPDITVVLSGDVKGAWKGKLSDIYKNPNGELPIDVEAVVVNNLRIAAIGKVSGTFVRLLQRKNGIYLNL